MMKIDRLIDAIERLGNPTALGLDTRIEYLPKSLAGQYGPANDPGAAAEAIRAFNRSLIDGLCDIVPCVKVQAAYYEALGPVGMEVFRDTLLYASGRGMITIADVKRNDIGATSEAYAAAYLSGPNENAPFPADFITLNAYLGADGIAPFTDACKKSGGGVFILVRTSNKSAVDFQDLPVQGSDGSCRPLYEHVGMKAAEWGEALMGERGYSAVGAVVGATWPEEGRKLRALLPRTFFLIPGYGAQGATARDLAGCFAKGGTGAVVNASRSLLCAHQKRNTEDFAAAARDEALRMKNDLRGIAGSPTGR